VTGAEYALVEQVAPSQSIASTGGVVSGVIVTGVLRNVRLPAVSTAVARTVAVAASANSPVYGVPVVGSLPSTV